MGNIFAGTSSISSLEISQSSGVTSNIQQQINSKPTNENGAIQLKSDNGISLIEFMDGRTDTVTRLIYSSQSNGQIILNSENGVSFLGSVIDTTKNQFKWQYINKRSQNIINRIILSRWFNK